MNDKHSNPPEVGGSGKKKSHTNSAHQPFSTDYFRYFRTKAATLALLGLLTYILFDTWSRVIEHSKEYRLSNDLSPYGESVFLPYTNRFGTDEVPCVKATINGTELNLPVDTGSTGLFIGKPKLPNVDTRKAPRGYQFLTSSTLLYTGHIVDLEITFHGSLGTSATSKVPVLIVERSVKCQWYNMTVDAGRCPPNPDDPSTKPIERDISRIMYMGVGFGRNRQDDDRAIAVPKGNPFLNILAINGRGLQSGAFRTGYTVSTEGIHLGLTGHNTQNFIFTDLERGATHNKDPRDWAMVGMSLRLNNGSTYNGSALIDTGIPQMYLRTQVGAKISNITIPNPNGHGYVRRVPAGTKIAVGFPNFDGVAGYSFVVGKGSLVEPKYVVPAKQLEPPYVNTGRNLLFLYSVAFDAVGGRFGFRPVPPGASSSKI
jgi:hypothetical protein